MLYILIIHENKLKKIAKNDNNFDKSDILLQYIINSCKIEEKEMVILNESLMNILEFLFMGVSVSYFFCQTHHLRFSKENTYILFYISFVIFFIFSFPFYDDYLTWIIYFFLSLFIISHICFKETLRKRLMMIGVFGLIYMIEEMITMIFIFIFFRDLWYGYDETHSYYVFRICLTNIQMLIYCFVVTKGFSHQLNQLKQFYFVPLGQGILLIIIYYFGVTRCQNILGYILIILTLLMIWCDYVLYQGFLVIRQENIMNIKHIQSEIFTTKQNDLRSLRHDMMNYLMILETMIDRNEIEEAQNYMEKMKKKYEYIEEDKSDI